MEFKKNAKHLKTLSEFPGASHLAGGNLKMC